MAVDPDQLDALAGNVAAIYREAETALTRALQRLLDGALDRDLQGPAWLTEQLAKVTTLRRAADRVQAAVKEIAEPEIRAALASAYRAGSSAATTTILAHLDPDDPLVAAARAAQDDVAQTGAVEALANALIADIGERSSNVLRDVTDIYRSVITGAVARTVTGVQTRRQAAQAAFAGFLQRGITGFTDRGGRRWRLASYVEMAVRTVTQRAAVQGEEDRLRALGVTLVSVSNAPEECELCEPFEGRILALSGPIGDITVPHQLTGAPVTVHVVATLAEARIRGLFHPNCRHSISAYIVGVSTLPRQPTADPTGRAARDKQRALERKIRAEKLQAAGALTPEAKKATGKKIRAAQAALREHLADHPTLKRLPYREQIGAGNMPPRGGNDPATPFDPPEPDGPATPPPAPAPDPVEPDAPAATASARTREAIDAALAQLPADTDGWDAPVATMRRGVDVQIDRRRDELARAEAELARVTAAIQAEFKRKRTPKAQRADILEDRTYDARLDVRNAQSSLDDFTARVDAAIARGGDLPDSLQLKPGYDCPRDPRGQAVAPPEWNEHLDAVLGVGERLADDLSDAIIDDPRHRELRRATLTDEVAAAKAKREYELLHELLASIRPMAGRHQSLGTAAAGTRSDWRTLVTDAEVNFPAAWLRLASARGPLNAVGADRAFFKEGHGHEHDVMAFNHVPHRHHGPGFSNALVETTTHELGHRMEACIPGLTHLEFALVRRQATRDGVVDRIKQIREIPGYEYYRAGEHTLEDHWGSAYSGKTYELSTSGSHPGSLSWELFTTALQDLFGRQDKYVGEIGQHFALGVLALLAPEED